jgi:hypothetical protein
MKRILVIIVIFTVSCSGKMIKPDLQTKSVYSARIILQDDFHYQVRKPFAVYFKRLASAGSLKEGTIIRSEEVNENGYISINAEPGVYTIIAASIQWERGNVAVIFNEEIMNTLKVELKSGEIKTTGETYIMFSNGLLLGKSDETQLFNRNAIAGSLAFMPYEYRPGFFDPVLHPSDALKKDNQSGK